METEREQAVHFIEEYEVKCTALMEQVLKSAENVFVLENLQNKNFCALFFLRNTSTLFHFIHPDVISLENPDYLQIKSTVFKFLNDLSIFCVYGEPDGTNLIKSLLLEKGKNLIASFDYNLLVNDFSSELFKTCIPSRPELEVRKCSLEDVDLLLELERGYRIEEVAISERVESDRMILSVLSHSLSMQNVFATFKIEDGKKVAVAKSATNGLGKNFYQIGGVYCRKDCRNQKITSYVMYHLLRYIQSQNKKANLFVKVHNEPAKKLYKNLGFVEVGKYQISYFQK